jgi:hypothetical protein
VAEPAVARKPVRAARPRASADLVAARYFGFI